MSYVVCRATTVHRAHNVRGESPDSVAQKKSATRSAPSERQGRVALEVEHLGIDRLAPPRQPARLHNQLVSFIPGHALSRRVTASIASPR